MERVSKSLSRDAYPFPLQLLQKRGYVHLFAPVGMQGGDRIYNGSSHRRIPRLVPLVPEPVVGVGRARYTSCVAAHVEARFRELTEEFVDSLALLALGRPPVEVHHVPHLQFERGAEHPGLLPPSPPLVPRSVACRPWRIGAA